jgi:anti-sigma factor RsiW
MNTRHCEQLDDFLSDELSADERSRFEQHLAECMACREQVDEWRSLQSLLRTASETLEQPSAELMRDVSGLVAAPVAERPLSPVPLDRAMQWRRIAAMVAACLLVAGLLSTLHWTVPQPDKAESSWVTTVTPLPDVELPENVIGVPIDIGDPDVTVVWVYPLSESTN